MSDKPRELDPDNPEDRQKMREFAKKAASEIFGENYKASDFDERELVSGDIELLGKSDAELFPDELEEYTPEERRKTFKVHSKENGSDEPKE